MTECFFCQQPIENKDLKIFKGKQWHIKCLRKLRKKARKQYYGNLDAAFKDLKEKKT